jgi:hypothetical protein
MIFIGYILFDSAVGVATGYGLDGRGARVSVLVGTRFFSSPCLPDQPLGPPDLVSSRNQGLFPWGKAVGV